jgi:hypothetical protein
MGRVKELAMLLADSVYISHLSDEEIMMALAKRYPDIRKDGLDSWLREQIQVVRENPNLYQEMVDIK